MDKICFLLLSFKQKLEKYQSLATIDNYSALYVTWCVKSASVVCMKIAALSGNTRIIIAVFVYLSFIRIDTSFNGKLEFAEPFTDFAI